MSQSKYRIKAVWLSLRGDNSVKMRIFCMQNVKQIFADLWLKNEVDDVPADHF